MIYVDQLLCRENVVKNVHCIGDEWCHMWADSLGELHVFAEKLFLPKPPDAIADLFHDHPALPHYDLSPSLRERAIALGAVEYDLTAFFRQQFRDHMALEKSLRTSLEPVHFVPKNTR